MPGIYVPAGTFCTMDVREHYSCVSSLQNILQVIIQQNVVLIKRTEHLKSNSELHFIRNIYLLKQTY